MRLGTLICLHFTLTLTQTHTLTHSHTLTLKHTLSITLTPTKEEKNKDNILPKLMASADNYEGLFTEEMKKYNTLTQQIDDNIAKQADVLSIIRKNVGVYKETFGYAEWRRSCEVRA